MPGHTRYVLAVAYRPDGQRLASTSGNPTAVPPQQGEVKVWDADTGREVISFVPEVACALSMAFSPDGRLLALCGMDRRVQVYDAETGQVVSTLRDHAGQAISVAFSRDGTLASGADDGVVILWDLESGKPRQTLRSPADPIWGLAFSPDGTRLAAASFDLLSRVRGKVKVWDTASGREALSLPGQFSVAFSPDGRRLAASAPRAPNRPGVDSRLGSRPPALSRRGRAFTKFTGKPYHLCTVST